MPSLQVRKSIFINAPVEQVHAFVRDFKQWPSWSPWLIAEPETHLEYSPAGDKYAWDGKIIGSGEMAIVREKPPGSIDYRLTFLKPWKSVNAVRFEFEESNGGTEVTWTMDGSLPFFLFWMKPMMTAFVGMDYQRGLLMLKTIIETGTNPSKLTFDGKKSFPGCRYIGVRTRCAITEIADSMCADMTKLGGLIESEAVQPDGPPFAIFHQWDPVKDLTEYTIAFPIKAALSSAPAGFVSSEIPSCEAYVIRHTGPYPFLGNAWAAGVMRQRSKVFKSNKQIAPFEIYQNDPREVPENELVTELHFPMRGLS